MKQVKPTAILPKKNLKISLAVRYKFFLLLVLTLALIFDVVVRPPSSKLFDYQSLPEMPAEN
ncbi:MAG: hypothetical protein AAGE96_17695 [Cyanobacteria bacterium P01_G01_bin.19]